MYSETVKQLIVKLKQETDRQRNAKEIEEKGYWSILTKIGEVEEEFAQ